MGQNHPPDPFGLEEGKCLDKLVQSEEYPLRLSSRQMGQH